MFVDGSESDAFSKGLFGSCNSIWKPLSNVNKSKLKWRDTRKMFALSSICMIHYFETIKTHKSQNSWREIGDAVKGRLWWKDFSPRLWVWRLWSSINSFTFRHGQIISHTNMLFQANRVNIFQNNYIPDLSLSKEMWNKKMAQTKNSKLGVRWDSFSVGSCLITNVEPIPLVQCHSSAEDRGSHGLALLTSRTTISWA